MPSFTTELSGTVTHEPIQGQIAPSGTISIPLISIKQSSSKHHHSAVTASAAVDATISFGNVSNAKFLLIQKSGGTMTFKLTTSEGTDQIVPIGKIFLWENAEKPITAIKYSGTGDFEVFLAEW